MRLIIAGSRTFKHITFEDIVTFLEIHRLSPTEVVSGKAQGIDAAGADWAQVFGFPIKSFPADWNKHGKAAGPIRNKAMAEYADALLLIWDGESKGSFNMMSEMVVLGKPVYEVVIKSYEGSKIYEA